MGQLDGKSAIITGSSRGVGADTAKLLAAEGAGVVVNYRQKAPRAKKVVQAIEEAGGRAVAVEADVTKHEDVQALVDEEVARATEAEGGKATMKQMGPIVKAVTARAEGRSDGRTISGMVRAALS